MEEEIQFMACLCGRHPSQDNRFSGLMNPPELECPLDEFYRIFESSRYYITKYYLAYHGYSGIIRWMDKYGVDREICRAIGDSKIKLGNRISIAKNIMQQNRSLSYYINLVDDLNLPWDENCAALIRTIFSQLHFDNAKHFLRHLSNSGINKEKFLAHVICANPSEARFFAEQCKIDKKTFQDIFKKAKISGTHRDVISRVINFDTYPFVTPNSST